MINRQAVLAAEPLDAPQQFRRRILDRHDQAAQVFLLHQMRNHAQTAQNPETTQAAAVQVLGVVQKSK